MAAYSFADVSAYIEGPGGSFPLGGGADGGAAEEGITIERTEDKNNMNVGAGGTVMHSLHVGRSGTVRVRLQKTSPVNALLQRLYAFQTGSAANHGQNTIVVRDHARGDIVTCTQVAFARDPSLTYAKDGGMNEWQFHAGYIDPVLGTGSPVAAF